MSVAFTIPAWLLWLLGVPIGLVILALAYIGITTLIEAWKWDWY